MPRISTSCGQPRRGLVEGSGLEARPVLEMDEGEPLARAPRRAARSASTARDRWCCCRPPGRSGSGSRSGPATRASGRPPRPVRCTSGPAARPTVLASAAESRAAGSRRDSTSQISKVNETDRSRARISRISRATDASTARDRQPAEERLQRRVHQIAERGGGHRHEELRTDEAPARLQRCAWRRPGRWPTIPSVVMPGSSRSIGEERGARASAARARSSGIAEPGARGHGSRQQRNRQRGRRAAARRR